MTTTRPALTDHAAHSPDVHLRYKEFWSCLASGDFERLEAMFAPHFAFILNGDAAGGVPEFMAMVRRWAIAFPKFGAERHEQFSMHSPDGIMLIVGEVINASTGLRPMDLPALFCISADEDRITFMACYFPDGSPLGDGNSRYPREPEVERNFRIAHIGQAPPAEPG